MLILLFLNSVNACEGLKALFYLLYSVTSNYRQLVGPLNMFPTMQHLLHTAGIKQPRRLGSQVARIFYCRVLLSPFRTPF